MQNVIIVEAEFIDNQTLRLFKPLDHFVKHVKVTIEDSEKNYKKRVFGCAKGLIEMKPDFDQPLCDFKE